MKMTKVFIGFVFIFSFSIIIACGGGGGGGTGAVGTGEVAFSITDAKPLLPDGATNLWITFSKLLVHKSGGSWISLPLVQTPYTIDLLQYYDGFTTELVPPTKLSYGKYTQVRIVVESATIRFNNDDNTIKPIEIPPGNLKTDTNFTLDIQDPAAADIIIDFDLSRSLVVTGQSDYKLKPVLHIVEASEAATIQGAIADESFTNFGSGEALVTVLDNNGTEYTKVVVPRINPDPVPALFNIFWLVPNQDYTVEIDMDPDANNGTEYNETVYAVDLQPGDVFDLNGGSDIILP